MENILTSKNMTLPQENGVLNQNRIFTGYCAHGRRRMYISSSHYSDTVGVLNGGWDDATRMAHALKRLRKFPRNKTFRDDALFQLH